MYGFYRSPSPPQMYNVPLYNVPPYGPVIYQTAPIGARWPKKWPNFRFVFIGIGLLLCSSTIIGLDIANIAIEGNKQNGTSKLGHSTDKVGAGIWTGCITFISATFILTASKSNLSISIIFFFCFLVLTRHKRLTLTFALFTVLFAFCFLIVLVGLIGNAIQTNFSTTNHTDAENIQNKILISILSFALLALVFCLVFFLFYIRAFFSSSVRLPNRY